MKKKLLLSKIIFFIFIFFIFFINNAVSRTYFLHKNITVTVFWIGESLNEKNRYTRNDESAWDNKWLEHYGGVDNPDNRDGFYPAGYIPLENPFYFALPCGDFDLKGMRKKKLMNAIPWAGNRKYNTGESVCKNRWIKITKGLKTAYAQWEDVGPFRMNDWKYVFGTSRPVNKLNNYAGLDVSPSVRDFLGLSGMDRVDWRFVDDVDVPEGPWKLILTTNQIRWE